jgi:hypothetical protein
MNNLIRYVPIALIAGYFLYANFSGPSSTDDELDLKQVLDVTVETIYAFEENNPQLVAANDGDNENAAFVKFSEDLTANYNAATPAIYKERITVAPQQDASLIAFVDADANGNFDSGEEALYMIEVDGENSRVIATSGNGAVSDSRFSGAGLLTGMLIGSMLSRQRASGANPASKTTQTSKQAQAARSRAGSGSHSRGK